MMKTVFSLMYFECPTGTENMLEAIVGPFLFQTETAAVNKLFMYVKDRITGDNLEEIVEGFLGEHQDVALDSLNDIESNNAHKKAFVDYYFKVSNADEGMNVEYAIVELPVSSFVEELNISDAIEIDANFIRHFNVLSPDEESNEVSNMYLEANAGAFQYSFSLDDVMNATYCIERKIWGVGGCDVTLVKFA